MPNKCKKNEKQISTCIPLETYQLVLDIAHSRGISHKKVYNEAVQFYAQHLEISTQSSQNTVNAEQGLLSQSNRLYNLERVIIYEQFSRSKKVRDNLQNAIANIISEEYRNRSLTDLLQEKKSARFINQIYDKLKKSDQVDIPDSKYVFKIICVHFAEDIDELIEQKLASTNEE